MFDIGDIVKIISHGDREIYKTIVGMTGEIKMIRTWHAKEISDDNKTYYVRIDGYDNPNQMQGYWCFDETQIRKIIKEKNIKMNIIEIYVDNKLRKIDMKHEKLIEEYMSKDEDYAMLMKIKRNPKLAPFVRNEIVYKFSDEINVLIHEENMNFETERNKVYRLADEVTAQLNMCETYEQKQAILKQYKIIKENGRVNA